MILIMLYSLTWSSQGKNNHAVGRRLACLEGAQQSDDLRQFYRARRDSFQMCFIAFGGQMAFTMVTIRLLGWARPSLEEWSSKQNNWNEWFMPPATFFKFWLISHEITVWNTSNQFLYSLFLCLADRRISQYWNIQFEPSICDAHCTIHWGQ